MFQQISHFFISVSDGMEQGHRYSLIVGNDDFEFWIEQGESGAGFGSRQEGIQVFVGTLKELSITWQLEVIQKASAVYPDFQTALFRSRKRAGRSVG